jgi:hypothetical protein
MIKELSWFIILTAAVLLVNLPILNFNLLYPEQPLIYVANQTLHSLGDLAAVYLHPQMLHFNIPFFRPSGHFLLYYFFLPVLGWHNTQALLVLNLLFLSLSGCLLIKLYRLWFPEFLWGGYLAFALYLMHPALILPRLISLHFEFAHIFFLLLSLYCFVVFCQKNRLLVSGQEKVEWLALLVAALLIYALAVSFKEPALLLGPVLMTYFLIHYYQKGSLVTYGLTLWKLPACRQILLLIAVLCALLALYLTWAWPGLAHPLGSAIQLNTRVLALKELFNSMFGIQAFLYSSEHHIQGVFSLLARLLLWCFALITVLSSILVFRSHHTSYKKALIFLYTASLFFLVLPVVWAMGLPWHLSLSLCFMSLIMGFSCEYGIHRLTASKKWIFGLGVLASILVGLQAVEINQSNIRYWVAQDGLALALRRNAILHPPKLPTDFSEGGIILVEDSILQDAYRLGNSAYPYPYPIPLLRKQKNASSDQVSFSKLQESFFIKYDPVYNGSLFKWAYLRPDLQEEEYPFRIEEMEKVPLDIIHSWLQHYHTIFCVGYDVSGQWRDRTQLFKKKLMAEKKRRALQVNHYDLLPATIMVGSIFESQALPLADYHLCQAHCDESSRCQGFVYENSDFQKPAVARCQFFDYLSQNESRFCATCIGFIKTKEITL